MPSNHSRYLVPTLTQQSSQENPERVRALVRLLGEKNEKVRLLEARLSKQEAHMIYLKDRATFAEEQLLLQQREIAEACEGSVESDNGGRLSSILHLISSDQSAKKKKFRRDQRHLYDALQEERTLSRSLRAENLSLQECLTESRRSKDSRRTPSSVDVIDLDERSEATPRLGLTSSRYLIPTPRGIAEQATPRETADHGLLQERDELTSKRLDEQLQKVNFNSTTW